MNRKIQFLYLLVFCLITLQTIGNAHATESFSPAKELHSVTFILTIHPQGAFDPGINTFFITGNMFEWMMPGSAPEIQTLSPTGENSNVFSITMELPAGNYEYKYYLNEGWEGGEMYCDSNRQINLVGDQTVNEIFTGNHYTLNLQASPENAGGVTGGGRFWTNSFVYINAIAEENFRFVNWTDISWGTDIHVSNQASHKFTMPEYNTILNASFQQIQHYEASFLLDVRCLGEFDPVVDTLFITGSMFQWMVPGEDPQLQMMHPTEQPGIFTNTLILEPGEYYYKYFVNSDWVGAEWPGLPDRQVYVSDHNIISYDIFSGDPSPGSGNTLNLVSQPEGAGQLYGQGVYLSGQTVELQAVPTQGYRFEKWTLPGQDLEQEPDFEFCMPGNEVTLVAHFISTVGINAPMKPSISVYPNPATHNIHISSSDIFNQLILLNTRGQIVININSTSDNQQLDISGLPQGIYLLKANTINGWVSARLHIIR